MSKHCNVNQKTKTMVALIMQSEAGPGEPKSTCEYKGLFAGVNMSTHMPGHHLKRHAVEITVHISPVGAACHSNCETKLPEDSNTRIAAWTLPLEWLS